MRPWHVVVVVIVILVLFGAPKLPELARSLGKSMRILKEETQQLTASNESESAEGDGTSTNEADGK